MNSSKKKVGILPRVKQLTTLVFCIALGDPSSPTRNIVVGREEQRNRMSESLDVTECLVR